MGHSQGDHFAEKKKKNPHHWGCLGSSSQILGGCKGAAEREHFHTAVGEKKQNTRNGGIIGACSKPPARIPTPPCEQLFP